MSTKTKNILSEVGFCSTLVQPFKTSCNRTKFYQINLLLVWVWFDDLCLAPLLLCLICGLEMEHRRKKGCKNNLTVS